MGGDGLVGGQWVRIYFPEYVMLHIKLKIKKEKHIKDVFFGALVGGVEF